MEDYDEEDEKVFMFAGFTSPEKIIERNELVDKIMKLGGEVDLSANWNNKCTHVITCNFETYNGKVLACLAAGGWVVTRRFVDRSYKTGTWFKSRPFICSQSVLAHREKRQREGPCFKDMTVVFLMELEMRSKAYVSVVQAGGGTVLENFTLEDLINDKPGTEEVTHVVVDPYILSDTDPRHDKFRPWAKKRKENNSCIIFIYYRFFFDYLRFPEDNPKPELYNIFSQKVVNMALQYGDMKRPNNSASRPGSLPGPGSLPEPGSGSGSLSGPGSLPRSGSGSLPGPRPRSLPGPGSGSESQLEPESGAVMPRSTSVTNICQETLPPGQEARPTQQQQHQPEPPSHQQPPIQALSLTSSNSDRLQPQQPEAAQQQQQSQVSAQPAVNGERDDVSCQQPLSTTQGESVDSREEVSVVDAEHSNKDGGESSNHGKRLADSSAGDNKRRKTEYTSHMIAPNVIELDDSDDDIQVLEQRLVKERGEKGRRVYYDTPKPGAVKKIISIDIVSDSSDHEETREASDIESVEEEDKTGEEEGKADRESEPPKSPEQEIEIVGTGQRRPEEGVKTKMSTMFKEKLAKVKVREEKREMKKLRASRKSRNTPEPAPEPIPVIRTVIPTVHVNKPKHPFKELKHGDVVVQRIIDSIREHDDITNDSIEVGHVTRRTAKYDKHQECTTPSKRLTFVEERVKEEFASRYGEIKDNPRRLHEIDKSTQTMLNNSVAELEILDYLQAYTNLTTHPTSSMLHVLMLDFILNQNVVAIALRSYQYISNLIFQYLGRKDVKREGWLHFILSAMRENRNAASVIDMKEMNLESSHDIQDCAAFFSHVIQRAMKVETEQVKMMLSLVVNICHKDFELWWKHHRETQTKDNRVLSYPVFFYLLNGGRDLMKHIQETVLVIFKHVLETDSVISEDVRKLLAMSGMLVAYLDRRDNARFIYKAKGMKYALAKEVSKIISTSSITSDERYLQLNLVRPTWLSQLASRLYLSGEKAMEKEVGSLKLMLDKNVELSSSCDTDLIAVMDNYLVKTFSLLQIHCVARTHWHIQVKSAEKVTETEYPVFSATSKLVKITDEIKAKADKKYWPQRCDIAVSKDGLVDDINAIVGVINKEKKLENFGVLKSLVFNMSSPDTF